MRFLAAPFGALFLCVAAAAQPLQVKGLGAPARIQIDQWGVPHIYAASEDDVFFVQGFNAARDRLFQIDLWRRRGLGELAAVFGPKYVEQDRATRLFLYRGDMRREWAAYGKDAQRISTRFVAGINAYIALTERRPDLLPFEFRLLKYQPTRWKAQDVVRIRSHGLTRNLTTEFARAHVVCQAGLAADKVRAELSHGWVTRVPEGLDPCFPEQALDVFTLATATVSFSPDTLTLARAAPREDTLEGSNNWVVAPSRTRTGRPLLANDPHRAYSTPSLRYIAHLSAPGLDVIGAGEPALPGISIGHNGRIAFGLTIFSIDQEDLYVYALNPANPRQYRYRDGWENFRVVKEKIAVRGARPVTVELRFTRHGPVIFEEPGKQRALAVRTAWNAPGMAPYFGSIEYMRARDFGGFRAAMTRWGAPTENQVYADTDGNIGWVAGGLAPVRPNWDGLLPVPGDGRYEWQGFLPGSALPSVLNPKEGYFASANEMNLPPDYPNRERKLGFEWPDGSRAQRIAELLAANPKASVEDMQRMQNDLVSLPARRLVALLKGLTSAVPRTKAALALLAGWDGTETAASPAAALYEVWWSRHLGDAYKAALLEPAAVRAMGAPNATAMLNALEHPRQLFGADAERKRDQVLLASLDGAAREMERLQGPDPQRWRWGGLLTSFFVHPLSPLVDAATQRRINVGPFQRGGGSYTLNLSAYQISNFWHIHGPSFRIVIDVGAWDNSRAMNTPGQAGDPANPHYRDLAPLWAAGEYFPLLYSRAAVDAATTETIELAPAR